MSQITGPNWIKQAKLEGGLDPLGLDRVSDRLTAELMPGISVNVNLARYFSLFPWLFDTTKSENADDLWAEIIRTEKVYILGTYLAHDGDLCASGVAGRDMVVNHWDMNKKINLDKIKWLSNGGVYNGLYKGPLFKLGLLDTDNKGRVVVTTIGKPIADAFNRAVSFTDWSKTGRSRATATRAEIKQFGKQCCPCSISISELNALRQLFFETGTPEGRILSQSFGFILSLIDQCERFEFPYLERPFRLSIYYRKILNDKNRPIQFKVLDSLNDVVTRWRSFQAHDYFSFALESLFSLWVEVMYIQPNQRLTLQQFMDLIDNRAFIAILKKRIGIRTSATSLRQISMEMLLDGLVKHESLSRFTAQNSQAFDRAIGLEHEFAEETLEDSILERYRSGAQFAERCAEALILLMVLYTRFYYQHLMGHNHPGWSRYEATASQAASDLGLPRFYWIFPLEELQQVSVYDFLVKVLNYSVIQQSLSIREERRRDLIWFSEANLMGLGDIAPTSQTYQYHFAFDNYRFYRNSSKLNNALALLSDIKYVTLENGAWKLTKDGRKRLQNQFGS